MESMEGRMESMEGQMGSSVEGRTGVRMRGADGVHGSRQMGSYAQAKWTLCTRAISNPSSTNAGARS